MKLIIDNLQGQGATDYTAQLDVTEVPRVQRKLNQPTQLRFSLVANTEAFVIPASGAKVIFEKENGGLVFTGYVTSAPQYEYLGWGEQAPVYRYNIAAQSDDFLLDQKALPNRAPFVERSAGSAIRQLAQNLLPGGFDTSGLQGVDTLAEYEVNPQKPFSYHAAEIAVAARASFSAVNGTLFLAPVAQNSYDLNETDTNFSPAGLWLDNPTLLVNDVTVIGATEPQAYITDYFAGDGLSLKFYLSQKPFAQTKPALIDERYRGTGLDPSTWAVSDPSSAISVEAETLVISGGTGIDGQTLVSFIEQIELGGAIELQHGDVSFTAACQGVFGGLYANAVSAAGCLAGFQITPAGSNCSIQALVNGMLTGPVITTIAGHRYFFTTFTYATEVYRAEQIYHSSLHPAASGWGGERVAADVRLVLEVQDIDPANPATLLAPATVLYDEAISNAPAFCTYALVNALNMQCSIAETYVAHISLPLIRTSVPIPNTNPQQYAPFVTELVGSAASGGQCVITSDPALNFYAQYAPVLNQLIVASYRGSGRAVAQLENAASVAALRSGADDGTRGRVLVVKNPLSRTGADCENAALAILDDGAGASWSGTYSTWSDYLPGAAVDLFPGDQIAVNVPTRNALFTAIVREVAIELADPANDRGFYKIGFANDLASPLALEYVSSSVVVAIQEMPPLLSSDEVGNYYQVDLKTAQITSVSSTTVVIDAGFAPSGGFGIEVRANDFGWGEANDRNLLGRFGAQVFTLARLARTQTYFLRVYDSSSPPKYSRYSAALHVDYPL